MELEKEIQELKEQQKLFQEDLKENSKILLRIESVIVDDPNTGRRGLGHRVTELEKQSQESKRNNWWIAGFVSGGLLAIKEVLHKIF